MKKQYLNFSLVALLLVAALLAACGDNTSTAGTSSTAAGSSVTSAAGTTAASGTTMAAMTTAAASSTTSASSTTMAAMTTSAGSTTAAGTTTMAAMTPAAGSTTSAGSTTMAAMTTAAGSTTAAVGAVTPNTTPVGTSPSTPTTYPGGTVLSLSKDLEKQFSTLLAPNITNAALLTFVTADDPAKVQSYFQSQFTAAGYTAAQAPATSPVPIGLVGQVSDYTCQASLNAAPASTPSNVVLPSGCRAAGQTGTSPVATAAGATVGSGTAASSSPSTLTASGIRVVALGPLDTTSILALTTLAPDLSKALSANKSIVMVFTGGYSAPRS